MKHAASSLLTKNKLGAIPGQQRGEPDYLDVVRAFARLTYESV